MRHRHELTDAQWQRIEPLLPGKAGDPGRTAVDNRLFVNAVLYVLKTGIPWADLPERLGKPNTIWKRYDRWCAAGVWERPDPAALLAPDARAVTMAAASTCFFIKDVPVSSYSAR